jgi:peptide/nickel transport system substrate-binding protein
MNEFEILRSTLTRRRVLQYGIAGIGSVAGLGLLEACGTSATSGTQVAQGGTLVFAEGTGPAHLDPIGPGLSSPLLGVWRQMYDTLVWTDSNLKVIPQLATSWKNLDDLTWEFKLRDGVKFHNGEAFTADAVKFTLERIVDPKQKSTQSARFTELDSVTVVDPLTVRIKTKHPFPVLLLGLTQAFIVAPQYVSQNPAQAATNPVGTGPFKFVSWTQGDRLTFAANKSYWGEKPIVDQVVFRVIPDDASRLAALKAGEVHIDMILPIDSIEAVSSDSNLRVEQSFIVNSLILMMDNMRGGPTANPVVRQAINYAIDKEGINKSLLRGKLRPLDGQLATREAFGYDPNVKAYPYDPEKAKALLTQAGYPNGFETVINGPIGKYTSDRDIVIAVADGLGKVGIKAKANPMEYGLFVQKLLASQLSPMFLIGWYTFGDAALADIWLTSLTGAYGHYYSPSPYDDLVTQGATALDPKARQAAYNKVAEYQHDQALAAWLFQAADYYGVSKKVVGFHGRPDETTYLLPTGFQK